MVAPQPIEAKLKQSEWISEAVLLGDRRPFVVCLIVPDFARLEGEAKSRGWDASSHRTLVERPDVRARFEAEVERVNTGLAPFEQIKRFALLDRELTQESGELTPSLKVKRRVVTQNFADAIEHLYAGHASPAST
jgi:long-chain acyl-CoA synthetase